MIAKPINNLDKCSVDGCWNQTEVIIQKTIGEVKVMFGYCQFHSIVSATFFPSKNRKEIHV